MHVTLASAGLCANLCLQCARAIQPSQKAMPLSFAHWLLLASPALVTATPASLGHQRRCVVLTASGRCKAHASRSVSVLSYRCPVTVTAEKLSILQRGSWEMDKQTASTRNLHGKLHSNPQAVLDKQEVQEIPYVCHWQMIISVCFKVKRDNVTLFCALSACVSSSQCAPALLRYHMTFSAAVQ